MFPKALLPRRVERRYRRAMSKCLEKETTVNENGMELHNIRAEALVYP